MENKNLIPIDKLDQLVEISNALAKLEDERKALIAELVPLFKSNGVVTTATTDGSSVSLQSKELVKIVNKDIVKGYLVGAHPECLETTIKTSDFNKLYKSDSVVRDALGESAKVSLTESLAVTKAKA